MKNLTLNMLFIIFTILINSCSYINYSKIQENNKKLYKEEIDFISAILASPNNMDSLIVNSKYYDANIFNLLKHQIKSEKTLILDYQLNNCEPFIQNIWVENECNARNNVNMEKCINIFIHFPCREDNPYNIIFVFSKINKEEKIVDIYATTAHF